MNVIFWNGGIRLGMTSRYIGPYKISHWIRKHGYQSQVLEFSNAWQEKNLYRITKKFITSETRILEISTTFLALDKHKWSDGSENNRMPESIINVARRIKSEYPKIKIVIGGYQSDLLSGFGVIDASVMSYTEASEDIFLEYLDHLTKGTPPPLGRLIFPKSKYLSSESRMWYDKARNPKYNIELDDFRFVKEDCILPGEPLPLDISRGCIFACKFCQYPHLGKGKLDYIRGMEYIEQEILENYKNFGTTRYYILDDTFNDTEIKLQAFYDMTQRLPFKISYSAYIRADLIDRFPNMAYLLQESGCFGAYHGIESFHPEASKLVGKAWSGKNAKEFLPKLYHDIWKGQVPQHTNFIVGFTGDTQQNVDDTVAWFIDNDMHSINFNFLSLFGPNNNNSIYTVQSEFDKNAEKYGYEFLEPPNGGFRSWKTDNWTTETAVRSANTANELTKDISRALTWYNPALEWYGYTKPEILKLKRCEVPWGEAGFTEITRKNQLQYFKMVMNLKV